jgi:hypothetical protein
METDVDTPFHPSDTFALDSVVLKHTSDAFVSTELIAAQWREPSRRL